MKVIFIVVLLLFSVVSFSQSYYTLGKSDLKILLDKEKNYSPVAIFVNGDKFKINPKFPGFVVYDKEGKIYHVFSDDARWTTNADITKNGVAISYTMNEFSVLVEYTLVNGMLNIKVTPETENIYKIVSLMDEGSLISLPASSGKEKGFIINPHYSGELIKFSNTPEEKKYVEGQSWDRQASFVGIGNNYGIILRAPELGGVWTVGTGTVNGEYSLYAGVTMTFRPEKERMDYYPYWTMPLVEKSINLQILPVSDINGDKKFNWVDMGVAYRNKFIKPNKYLDKSDLENIQGKIDISAYDWDNTKNYSELIAQIKKLNFAPHKIWLVGAHTKPENGYVDPPYTEAPDPSHNGDNGYDYFAFKNEVQSLGSKIGLHEIFIDMAESNEGWGTIPIRHNQNYDLVGTWGGEYEKGPNKGKHWQAYSKATQIMWEDKTFQKSLDEHFNNWQVKSGDTWHWDVMTAAEGTQDFNIDHPATKGSDIRLRMKIFKYVNDKGIDISSEGLQEGMSEYCNFSWSARITPGWQSIFAGGKAVPLLPVIFQGATHYAFPTVRSQSLLYGGKLCYEFTSLDKYYEDIIDTYFYNTLFWGKIANKTVKNIYEIKNGWQVDYSDGDSLKVNDVNNTFIMKIGKDIYTQDSVLTNSYGYSAKKVLGKYKIMYNKSKDTRK